MSTVWTCQSHLSQPVLILHSWYSKSSFEEYDSPLCQILGTQSPERRAWSISLGRNDVPLSWRDARIQLFIGVWSCRYPVSSRTALRGDYRELLRHLLGCLWCLDQSLSAWGMHSTFQRKFVLVGSTQKTSDSPHRYKSKIFYSKIAWLYLKCTMRHCMSLRESW